MFVHSIHNPTSYCLVGTLGVATAGPPSQMIEGNPLKSFTNDDAMLTTSILYLCFEIFRFC